MVDVRLVIARSWVTVYPSPASVGIQSVLLGKRWARRDNLRRLNFCDGDCGAPGGVILSSTVKKIREWKCPDSSAVTAVVVAGGNQLPAPTGTSTSAEPRGVIVNGESARTQFAHKRLGPQRRLGNDAKRLTADADFPNRTCGGRCSCVLHACLCARANF